MSAQPFNDRARQPFEKSYPEGVAWDAKLEPKTMVELFDESVRKFAARDCTQFLGKTFTYKEIGQMVDGFAANLQKQGVKPGDRVGICMPNNPYYIVAYYGALKAGGTVVNFNPLYADEEMAHLINDSGAETMVTMNIAQVQPRVESMLGKTTLKRIVSCDIADLLPVSPRRKLRILTSGIKLTSGKFVTAIFGTGLRDKLVAARDKQGAPELTATKGKNIIPMSSMLSGKPKPVAITEDQVAVLQFTGGTTGLPKAAMLTHKNLAANVRQAGIWFAAGRDNDDQQKVMNVLPFFHVFSMTVQMNLSLHMGDALIINKPGAKVDLTYLMALINDEKPAIFAGVPDLYKKMLEHRQAMLDSYAQKLVAYEALSAGEKKKAQKPLLPKCDMTSLKVCVSGAAPLPQRTWDSWKQATGAEIVEGYGLSKTAPLVIANPLKGVKKVNSIGLPVPLTEVRITNLEFPDQTVPVKVEGEICLRGPQIMKGYWQRQDETDNVMTPDGFFRTGDVGYIDEDGYVFITDRIKDMIIVNGFKAFPRHIEEAVMKHPSVAEVIVMGVPDEEKGEAVKAFIVLHPGQKVTGDELNAFLKEKLVHYEMPKAKNIEFRADLPKTMIGKPDRKALKAEEKAKRETPKN